MSNKTITWLRPSGTEITTNDREETVLACERKGWKRHNDKKMVGQAPKKRGRPRKDA